MIIDIHPLLNL